jgi:hypothetical protein
MIMVLNIHQYVNLKSPQFIILVTFLALPAQRIEILYFINWSSVKQLLLYALRMMNGKVRNTSKHMVKPKDSRFDTFPISGM